jgi:pimeloyl-ACP methyl ester carboxylesterase
MAIYKTSASGWDLSNIFSFEGQQIRYGILGDGEPLVLLHGTPFSSVVWRKIAPYLARHRRVFYFDLLGYGKSEKRSGQDVSLGIQNLLFTALLDHWQIDLPDVVAHDFGGTTALRAHLLNNCNYRSLTLIDPVAIGPSGSELVQAAKDHEQTFTNLPAYIHEAILRAYIGGAVFNPLSDQEMQLYLEPWLGAEGQAAFYRQIAQMSDRYTDEIESQYSDVRCPVTILWGEQDSWIPLEKGKQLAQRIPKSELHVISESRHLVQEDTPEAIIAIVNDFLLKVDNF